MSIPSKEKSAKADDCQTISSPSFDQLLSYDVLYAGFLSASKNKKSRATVINFKSNLNENINELLTELKEGTYLPKEPRHFEIYCSGSQKKRKIGAPTFRDCIIQHAVYELIYPTFDRGFIHDSYGCRRGKGTHKAADRLQQFMRKCDGDDYYIQMDVKKFYHSITHKSLEASFRRKIKCDGLIRLIMSFLPINSNKGLHIGVVLSQLCGLIILDRLDHFIKRVLKVKQYIRYVDDFVAVGISAYSEAKRIKETVESYIAQELSMKFSKWNITKIKHGCNFVGFRTWKSRRFIRKRSMFSFTRALKKENHKSVQAILAHSENTSSFNYLLNKLRRYPRLLNKIPKRFRLCFFNLQNMSKKAQLVRA